MYEYRATILRVVDGDTVHAEVDLGFDIRFQMTLRLFGINAPEMKTPAGPPAKEHLIELLRGDPKSFLSRLATTTARTIGDNPYPPVVVRTQKDHQEKYGRYLATLLLPDGTDVNAKMVADGFAVVYLL